MLRSIGVLKRCEILKKMGRVEEVEEAEVEAEDMVGPLGECWCEFVGLAVYSREG